MIIFLLALVYLFTLSFPIYARGGNAILADNGTSLVITEDRAPGTQTVGSNAAISQPVKPSIISVLVNGTPTTFESYNIDGANYFKLRDIAYAINGTAKQFDVAWDDKNRAIKLKTNHAYTIVGGEMAIAADSQPRTASPSTSKVFVNEKESRFSSYDIGGNAYFKLRDIAAAIDFGVTWNAATSTVGIDTSIAYQAELPSSDSNSDDSLITRNYEWTFKGKQWSWRFQISKSTYLEFRNRERITDRSDWAAYATDPQNTEYLSSLVKLFRTEAAQANLSERGTIDLVIAFVQSIPYVTDIDSTGIDDFPKYPLETLAEYGGDCEDTSFLMASMLQSLGYGVILLHYPDHVAVAVKGSDLPGTYYEYKGNRYYFLETTGENNAIGEIWGDYNTAEIIPVIAKPVMKLDFKYTCNWGTAKPSQVTVTVKNLGSATSYGTTVYAAFGASGNRVYTDSQTTSEAFNLPPFAEKTVTLSLKTPRRVNTQIVVKILSQGQLLNSSSSDWFNIP